MIEAYRESLPAVISALLQTNAGVQATASNAPQTSAADIEAALKAQIEKANGTCTKEYVEGIVRVAKSAEQHAQMQMGAEPQPGATTGAARLVALAEKQSQVHGFGGSLVTTIGLVVCVNIRCQVSDVLGIWSLCIHLNGVVHPYACTATVSSLQVALPEVTCAHQLSRPRLPSLGQKLIFIVQ